MNDIIIPIISGVMALLGVALSSVISAKSVRKNEEWERKKDILAKKEGLYIRVIKELDISSTQNTFIKSSSYTDFTGEESFELEAQMQLYAPKALLIKYHQAVEASEADLPHDIKESRFDALVTEMRRDLEIEV